MKIHFPDFAKGNVVVVGDLMLDRYWHGGTSRISPEAPVPVVKVEQIEERPGGAGNVALNIASLGAQVTLIGITGADEAAHSMSTRLEAAGVNCRFEAVSDVPTITKLRIISRHQQLIRLDFEDSFQDLPSGLLLPQFEAAIGAAGVLILSDYAKGTLTDCQTMIAAANTAGVPILVDPKGTDFSRYRGASLVTPNLVEFEAVVGHCKDETTLVERGNRLLTEHDWKALLITRGEHGMTLLRNDAAPLHLPARAREVFDVTGAGDTVIGTLAAAYAAGEDLAQATALANLAASVVVGKLGTASISAPELRRRLRDDDEMGHGVVTEQQLTAMVNESKSLGEKVVMTNGCFDILHAGHVGYLREARALGDRLIVAVNDDQSVAALKGEGRPINALERRMAVLAALGSVDWVVAFSEDTPERLINAILPDVLVKGGDYQVEQIAGHKAVIANGGEVKVLGFAEGISTTNIIESIAENNNG